MYQNIMIQESGRQVEQRRAGELIGWQGLQQLSGAAGEKVGLIILVSLGENVGKSPYS